MKNRNIKNNKRIEKFIKKKEYFIEKHPIKLLLFSSITLGFTFAKMESFFSLHLLVILFLLPQIFLIMKSLSLRTKY